MKNKISAGTKSQARKTKKEPSIRTRNKMSDRQKKQCQRAPPTIATRENQCRREETAEKRKTYVVSSNKLS